MENIAWFKMEQFNSDKEFPLFVQYGHHQGGLGRHGHSDYLELVVILSGSATHIVAGKSYELGRGDAFIIPIGLTHSYADAKSLKVINIMFAPSFLENIDKDIKVTDGYRRFFETTGFSGKHVHLKESRLQRIIFICDNIIRENERQYPGWKMVAKSLFFYAITEFSRIDSEDFSVPESALAKIEDSRDCIYYSFMGKITVEDLARRTGYSTRHFVRLFTETYKMTPSEYLFDVRLKHACNLLKVTTLPIAEVARQSGFQSAAYFSKFFGEKMGMTPREYRKSDI